MFTALGAQMPQSANYAAKIRHFGYICKYFKKKRKKLTYFFDTTYCTKYQKIVILQSKHVQFHSRKWYYI